MTTKKTCCVQLDNEYQNYLEDLLLITKKSKSDVLRMAIKDLFTKSFTEYLGEDNNEHKKEKEE